MYDGKKELARRLARSKMRCMKHLAIYVVTIVVLVIVNIITGFENQWWIWPALSWGAVIVGHFVKSFILSHNLEKKIIEVELENLEEEDENLDE